LNCTSNSTLFSLFYQTEVVELLNGAEFSLLAVTAQIAETAASLRSRYNIRTPDALHLATALDAGCAAFLTSDLGLKRVTEITILVLEELDTG